MDRKHLLVVATVIAACMHDDYAWTWPLRRSKVTIAFAKGSPEIEWDIHSHDHAGGTKIHDEGKGGDGMVEFVAPCGRTSDPRRVRSRRTSR